MLVPAADPAVWLLVGPPAVPAVIGLDAATALCSEPFDPPSDPRGADEPAFCERAMTSASGETGIGAEGGCAGGAAPPAIHDGRGGSWLMATPILPPSSTDAPLMRGRRPPINGPWPL